MEWIYEEDGIRSVDETGKLLAEAVMENLSNGEIDITHVFVDDSLRGQGIAGKVMEKVIGYLRENNKKAVASCSYANSWLMKNQEFCKDVISEDMLGSSACRIDGKH